MHVIVHVPIFLALTFPEELTVAILVFDDFHVAVLFADVGFITFFGVKLCPNASSLVEGDNLKSTAFST